MAAKDVVVVGAGASGLMAAIWARRTDPDRTVLLLDSARKIGAKILISGGGRCNLTHHEVDATAFAGSSRNAIKKVLRVFDVGQTVAFFAGLGVELKREDTGKLFPVTDDAQTVLDALLRAATDAGVEIVNPWRVESVSRHEEGLLVSGPEGRLTARRVVLATGGRSIPKSGSDGHGYEIARGLGHTTTRTFPALVPLTLPRPHFTADLSGLAVEASLSVVSPQGKRRVTCTGSLLCTHFGLSGPVALDVSRHLIEAQLEDPASGLEVNWLGARTTEQVEQEWQDLDERSVLSGLRRELPARLVRALAIEAGLDPDAPGRELRREVRHRLARVLTAMRLPVTGNRGFHYAEVTAGGVPLTEVRLVSMESRVCPGLYLCGQILDVDGRIGGFNFQWAWSSGYAAGVAVAAGP